MATIDWARYEPEICLIQEIGEDEFDVTVVCGPGGFIDRESAFLSDAICRAAYYAGKGARIEWCRYARIAKIADGGRVSLLKIDDGWTVYIYPKLASDGALQVAHNAPLDYAMKMVVEAVSYGAVFDAVYL